MATITLTKKNVTFNDRCAPITLYNHSDDETLLKHPLLNSWTLWYYKPDKAKEWMENLLQVSSFGTAEDFWALYNYIQPASRLASGCDYSLFKEGVRPMWEDPTNRNGGRWLINLDKRMHYLSLDTYWLDMLLCIIGEAFFDETDEICGVVVNIRNKADKLALWTRDAMNSEANVKIGRTLKSIMKLSPDIQLEYQSHADTMEKCGSSTKVLYTV